MNKHGLRSAFNNVPVVNRKASCGVAKMACHSKSCKEKPRRESPLLEMSLRSGIGFIELIELIDDSQLGKQLASIYKQNNKYVGLPDGAMHVQAVLYRTTRIKTLCMEGSHWNQGE
jgi:hypothetical protein